MSTTADRTDALDLLDEAIALVGEAREACAGNETLTGSTVPGSEGFFGPVLHDLDVLRGRVADPTLTGLRT